MARARQSTKSWLIFFQGKNTHMSSSEVGLGPPPPPPDVNAFQGARRGRGCGGGKALAFAGGSGTSSLLLRYESSSHRGNCRHERIGTRRKERESYRMTYDVWRMRWESRPGLQATEIYK